eukprot:6827091-Prymnesium_polylepis.1
MRFYEVTHALHQFVKRFIHGLAFVRDRGAMHVDQGARAAHRLLQRGDLGPHHRRRPRLARAAVLVERQQLGAAQPTDVVAVVRGERRVDAVEVRVDLLDADAFAARERGVLVRQPPRGHHRRRLRHLLEVQALQLERVPRALALRGSQHAHDRGVALDAPAGPLEQLCVGAGAGHVELPRLGALAHQVDVPRDAVRGPALGARVVSVHHNLLDGLELTQRALAPPELLELKVIGQWLPAELRKGDRYTASAAAQIGVLRLALAIEAAG